MGVIGDRWAVLIMRDAFQGVRRFEQFRERTGATRATLADRLGSLVGQRLLRRVPYSRAPLRYEYRLTERGRDLFGVALMAWRWERSWARRGAGVPARLAHAACGHSMLPVAACRACGGVVDLASTEYVARPGARARGTVHLQARRLSPSTSATHRGSTSEFTHVADIVGDQWTPLVLSAAYFGLRRFDEIQAALGIASNILARRLARLVEQRLLTRRVYSRRPLRHEYRLTARGSALFPYAMALMRWGDRWLPARSPPTCTIRHRPCGRPLETEVRCSHCRRPLAARDVEFGRVAAATRPIV